MQKQERNFNLEENQIIFLKDLVIFLKILSLNILFPLFKKIPKKDGEVVKKLVCKMLHNTIVKNDAKIVFLAYKSLENQFNIFNFFNYYKKYI